MFPLRHDGEVYDFRGFRLSVTERRLTRDGETIVLAPKAFDVLVALVRNDGKLLGKRELIDLVWEDQAIEEGNLVNNIYYLRKTLEGSLPAEESMIETVPRHGYRFRGGVTRVERPSLPLVIERFTVTEVITQEIDVAPEPSRALTAVVPASWIGGILHGRARLALGLLVAVAGLCAVVGFGLRSLKDAGTTFPPPILKPLTGLRGWERDPAFSRDGNRVAYAWNGLNQENFDIYISDAGNLSPIRLTDTPANELNPLWSPDGKTVAFQRQRDLPDGPSLFDLVVKPLDGGPERIVATGGGAGFDWSPDGNWFVLNTELAANRPLRLCLVECESGLRRDLATDPSIPGIDYAPKFSPDGKTIAFCRSLMHQGEIYTVPVAGGPMRRVTSDNSRVDKLCWTPDGREILYASNKSGVQALWRIPVKGGESTPIAAAVGPCIGLAVSFKGERLAYQQVNSDLNVWQSSIVDPDRRTRLIGSTQQDDSPQYSPDGKRIAYSSTQSGTWQIWIGGVDGSTPRPVTKLVDHGVTGTPRWSPDGKWIAFDSSHGEPTDIYVVSADGGEARPLTDGVSINSLPSWSPDGKWVFFCSRRSGTREIWKVPFEGGQPVQVTRQGGWESWAGPDRLYFTKRRGVAGIWTVPFDGGPETLVPELAEAGGQRYWMVSSRGIWFTLPSTTQTTDLKFFDFATRRITTRGRLPRLPLFPNPAGLSISPDETMAAFIQDDQPQSTIVVLERFR